MGFARRCRRINGDREWNATALIRPEDDRRKRVAGRRETQDARRVREACIAEHDLVPTRVVQPDPAGEPSRRAYEYDWLIRGAVDDERVSRFRHGDPTYGPSRIRSPPPSRLGGSGVGRCSERADQDEGAAPNAT